MKATIQKQSRIDGIKEIVVTHDETGYQLQITQSKKGFVIHSAEGVTFRRYDDLAYEVEPERGYDDER
jgi:hypothetical protein